MAKHFSPHHGGGWRYYFHIPVDLRPMLGGKTAFRRYIPRCTKTIAEAVARQYALDDAARLAACRVEPEAVRTELAAGGGLEAILTDESYRDEHGYEGWQGGRGHYVDKPDQTHQLRLALAEAVQRNIGLLKPSNLLAYSWDVLFSEWKRVNDPTRTRDHKATTGLLKAFFGEVDCREVTPKEIGEFRDHLMVLGVPRSMVAIRLSHIHTMYSAATSEPTSVFAGAVNPAAGVKVLGKVVRRKDGSDKVFTHAQARTVLETAASSKFWGKRHAEILWVLRLLTYSGARPNEICQLQGGDICEEHGVKFIRIQDTDAATGKRHLRKSLKTDEARAVPLHPAVMDFFDYAATFPKDAFIFSALTWNKDNGRAAYLISKFPKFLREDCGIVEPTKRLSLYSTRHTFISAMNIAKVPDKQQKQLVGHGKDVHSRYAGNELELLRDYVASVEPLGRLGC